MAKWINSDGLAVKLGADEGDPAKGGDVRTSNDIHVTQFDISYTDALSATYAVLGSASTSTDGAYGVMIPKNARIKAIEVLVTAAFTSSGTIGSSTLGLGFKKQSDFSTELDHDGLLTASFVGGRLDAVGERTYVEIGSTGAGALIGTSLSENGVICLANTAHASHPYTAGSARIRVEWFFR